MRLEALRERIAQALKDVVGVVALRRAYGSVAPHLFQKGEELDDLALWPKYPLANVLRLLQEAHPESTLAIVCRGCDERQLVELAKRKQVDLAKVRVIGLACTTEEAQACQCEEPYPTHIDVGGKVEGVSEAELEGSLPKDAEERWAFWRHQFQKCFKCYGCRNICPLCFCKECSLEEGLWVVPGRLPPPFPIFHLIRAMHTVARCVDCGECEAACPAEIPLTTLYSLLRKDAEELFDYVPGRSLEEEPPLLLDTEI